MSDLWLMLAGVAAGVTGSVAGLASLVSYPALLAVGLAPLTANVTNTVALFGATGGSLAGSRRELRGQARRVIRLASIAVLGGALGAVVLLVTPDHAFKAVVPWLVGLGALLLLGRDRIRRLVERREASQLGVRKDRTPRAALCWVVAVFLLSMYAGYFGAGAGIIALAALGFERVEPLAVTNAVKNAVTGAANAVAAIAYVLFGPVHWSAAVLLGAGAVVGGCLGPAVVRVAPERPLRWLVGLGGLALAVYLAAG